MAKTETKVTTAADVRSWANENGHEVGARGRIPATVIAEFNKGRRGNARFTPADQTV